LFSENVFLDETYERETQSLSSFQNETLAMMIYRKKRKINSLKYNVTFCSLNTVAAACGNVICVGSSVAGGVVFIIVLLVVWWRVRRRWRNNDQPLIDNNADGGVNDFVNNYIS